VLTAFSAALTSLARAAALCSSLNWLTKAWNSERFCRLASVARWIFSSCATEPLVSPDASSTAARCWRAFRAKFSYCAHRLLRRFCPFLSPCLQSRMRTCSACPSFCIELGTDCRHRLPVIFDYYPLNSSYARLQKSQSLPGHCHGLLMLRARAGRYDFVSCTMLCLRASVAVRS
jgi:hypothetical protein